MPRRVVMISSTARDLPTHREQVRLACEQAGFAPHDMMEHLTALDTDAVAASLQMVERADVYIGIFAHRYGHVPDGHDISITEMEYNRAVELNKPRLIFFAHEDHDFKKVDIETGRGAEKLEVLKDKVGKARVAAFFRSALDLRGHVVAALAALSKQLDAAEAGKGTEEQRLMLLALVEELRRQGFVQRAAEAGVGEKAVIEFARRLKPNEELTLDQALKEVSAAVETAITVMQKGEGGSNLDNLVDDVRKRVAEKTGAGDIDGAALEADRGFAEWERAEAQRHERSLRSGIALLEARLEQDILRRDAAAAAQRVQKIVALELPNIGARFIALSERQQEYHRRGLDRGINFDLLIAIELARVALAAAQGRDERGPALNNLGMALLELGQRESGTARLEEAVTTFHEALKVTKRHRAPLNWAAAQNNLGNALASLSERESSTARLEQAVGAYREALKEYTRDRVPLVWAGIQNNLGNALESLGRRERGTARLEEAVAACREALKERTRDRVPLDWATTQINLGKALYSLGMRENGTARLEEAVAAFREALKEKTRDRVPLEWAMTQSNLGAALQTLGSLESGTARLEEAVAAFREALEERARERVPLSWATTQNNLGNALHSLGSRETGSTARLQEAAEAFREALKERTRERAPLEWAMTQNNLGGTLASLGRRERDTARLGEAVLAFHEALKERTRDQVPFDWAATQNNLGTTLTSIGEREAGTVRLEEAVSAFREALKEYTRDQRPQEWAVTQNNLGNALARIGERESGTARLEEAVAAFRQAFQEWTRDRAPLSWAMNLGGQGIAFMHLAQRRGDIAMAQTALSQITTAFETCRNAGHAANAAFFQNQLPAARALVERLRGP